jgi:hypothetical protein
MKERRGQGRKGERERKREHVQNDINTKIFTKSPLERTENALKNR